MTDSNVHAIEIGSDKQLFIDQRFIESSTGVKLSMNPPVKAEPVLPFGCDTVNQCFWDARLNKYVAYVRTWGNWPGDRCVCGFGCGWPSWLRFSLWIYRNRRGRSSWAQEVWWKQGPDVGKLAGRSVRLRIRMRVAKLVAFQFVDL
jgi:hypothetical protein